MKRVISLFTIFALVASISSISFASYNFKKPTDNKVDGVTSATKYIKDVEKKEIVVPKEVVVPKKIVVPKEVKEIIIKIESEEDDDDKYEMDENERKTKFKDEYKNSEFRRELEKKLTEIDDDDDDNDTDQIKDLKKRVNEIKVESVKIRNEIRKAIRSNYSTEELAKLEILKAELLKEYQDIKVLNIDSILSNAAVFKFDTLPVIKSGRTLLPVSAITKGIGAEIEWIASEKKIIITKGEDVIELWIDNNIALVNGKEVKLDASPEIMNSRTIVPLRFIVETFKFKVEWNEEDETIEIIDINIIENESETVSGSSTNVTVSGSSTDVILK